MPGTFTMFQFGFYYSYILKTSANSVYYIGVKIINPGLGVRDQGLDSITLNWLSVSGGIVVGFIFTLKKVQFKPGQFGV